MSFYGPENGERDRRSRSGLWGPVSLCAHCPEAQDGERDRRSRSGPWAPRLCSLSAPGLWAPNTVSEPKVLNATVGPVRRFGLRDNAHRRKREPKSPERVRRSRSPSCCFFEGVGAQLIQPLSQALPAPRVGAELVLEAWALQCKLYNRARGLG